MPIDSTIPGRAVQGAQIPPPNLLGMMRDVHAIREQQAQAEVRHRALAKQQQIDALANQYANDHEAFIREVSRIDPLAAQTFAHRSAQARRESAAAQLEELKRDRAYLATGFSLVQGATPEDYPTRREIALKIGGDVAAQLLPEDFDPQAVEGALSILQSTDQYLDARESAMKRVLDGDVHGALAWLYGHSRTPEQWQATTALAEQGGASGVAAIFGEFSPENQARALQIAGGTQAGQREPHSDYGRFETDYLASEAAKRGKAVEDLTPAERVEIKTAARKAFGRADDAAPRPLAPIVIQTNAGPRLVDRGTSTARPITDETGEVVGPTDTAEMRNRRDALKGMVPALRNMRRLSEQIITRVGPSQRADAAKRGVEAVFGSDPEFRTYRDFREALGVMIAVATQGSRPSDADVFRAALPMIPSPYSDTAESARMKWDMVFDMFANRLSPEMKRDLGLDDQGRWRSTAGGPAAAPARRNPFRRQ